MATVAEPKVPADLKKALMADPEVAAMWNDITPIARRDWIGWVDQAKQAETRARRIEQVGSKMKAGKRRPCCYAVVPMNLYKAIGADPKAKATWSDLSPDEKRDFACWVDSPGLPADRKLRTEEARRKLAAGERKP